MPVWGTVLLSLGGVIVGTVMGAALALRNGRALAHEAVDNEWRRRMEDRVRELELADAGRSVGTPESRAVAKVLDPGLRDPHARRKSGWWAFWGEEADR